MPCNYIHSHLGWQGDSIDENCIADLERQQEYLGNINAMIYLTD